MLLGGDVSVSLVHRPATPEQLAWLEKQGRVSQTRTMRAMAYVLRDGEPRERQLMDLKAVDANWPLFGEPVLRPADRLSEVIACEEDGVCGVAAEQSLLDRLKAERGDLLRIGDATFRVIAALDKEPDRISTGFNLGLAFP